jgi:hypothetical protein
MLRSSCVLRRERERGREEAAEAVECRAAMTNGRGAVSETEYEVLARGRPSPTHLFFLGLVVPVPAGRSKDEKLLSFGRVLKLTMEPGARRHPRWTGALSRRGHDNGARRVAGVSSSGDDLLEDA